MAQFIMDSLGREKLFDNAGKKLNQVKLREVAGKAIIVFEKYATNDKAIDSCTIADRSESFINFRREYAATNILADLENREKVFF